MGSGRSAWRWAIPLVAIVAALFVYSFYRQGKDVSSLQPEAYGNSNKVISDGASNAPIDGELERAKQLKQEFLGKADQNLADRNGDGFKKNQALAYDMLTTLREVQNKTTDGAAQKYLAELSRLVNEYYDQLVRFNSDKDQLVEINQSSAREIEQIQQDSSLSESEKIAKKREIKGKYFDQALPYSGSSQDIEAAVKALRSL